MFREEVFAINY